jgi:hypothetical protein
MRCRPLPYVLPVVLSAGLLMSACSAAPKRQSIAGSATTAATSTVSGTTSATGPTAGGNVHLTAYTDNDGPTFPVILSGAVGDYGKAQSVNPDGSVNTEHNGQLNLMLTHGSFRLGIAELDKKFVAVLAKLPVNPTTCSITASVSERVPVVAGSGTGLYKGISGAFTLTVTLDEVDKPAGCSASSPYLAQAIVITGPGTISVG